MLRLSVYILFFFLLSCLFSFSGDYCFAASHGHEPYTAIPGLFDLRSTFSDGSHSIEELVRLARSRGFKVLFINDHDRITVSYGIPPFRSVLSFKKELPSIMTHGPEKFLHEIQRVAIKYPDMIIIPGFETSAYYYWSGSFLKKDLTLHEFDRRLLVVNLNAPYDYEHVPNIHNQLSLRNTKELLPRALLYVIPFILGIYLLKRRAILRYIGLLLIIISLLAMVDVNPFRSSLFTPYHGDEGIRPYQELINYVHERGGLSFWNYPEQQSGIRKVEYTLPNILSHLFTAVGFPPNITIQLNTPPYPHVLYESKGYTGFSAIYGDRITATDPGKAWDRALIEYCRNRREMPPWGISTADFHQDGCLGLRLGAFPTTFLVNEISKEGILEALKKGRVYCSRGDAYVWPKLEYFNVAGQGGQWAFMGETLITAEPPIITFKLTMNGEKSRTETIYLIRGGKLLHTYTGKLPLEIDYVDTTVPPGQKTYYRLMDKKKHFVSNPIFVEYRPEDHSE